MTIEITRHWRVKAQRYQMTGAVCTECGHKMFPPREVCPECAELERSFVAVLPFSEHQLEIPARREAEPALV